MATIAEGNLNFIFEADCQVTKYDEWSFFHNQFQNVCGGAKAVDIVCIKNSKLWLIEIKDYRQPNTKKVVDLAISLSKKVRDTLAGLVAAQYNANNQQEKQFAKIALQTKKLALVFHIEQPVKASKLFPQAIDPADLKQKLKGYLKAIDAHPKIINKNTIKNNMPWTVI